MDEKFVFELNFQELLIVLKGLKELPYKESAPLVQLLSNEYEKQAREKELARKKENTKEVSKAK